jgi:fatty acid desaturase
MNTKEWKDKINNANFWFEVASVSILLTHVFMTFVGTYYDWLPFPIMVILFTCTRTGLAGVGHYHCHRRKDNKSNWGDTLFDVQYVGATVTITDGHVMMHHFYTNTTLDTKRTIFTGMLDLPRLWRVPVYTV